MTFLSKIFKNKYFLFSLFFLGGIVLFVPEVWAQGDTFGINRVGGFLPLGGEDIRVIAAKIIRLVLSLLGIIAVGLMLYAGFTWMTSGGDEEKISTAKKTLINATIGLAIIMASFAITQFVLKSLQDATGSGDGNDVGAGGGQVPACGNFADCQANGGGPRECGDEGFVVKSLTPRTPLNDGTGMTNTVIRAVFSRPLDADQNPNKIFRVSKGTDAVPVRNVTIQDGRQIVEAYFDQKTDNCKGIDGRSCLTAGDYNIEVNPEMMAGGVKLQTRLNCGEFDNRAAFRINQDFLDVQKPSVSSFTLNGRNALAVQNLARGSKYRLNSTFEDRKKDVQGVAFGGMSYLQLRVQSEPKDPKAAKTDWMYFSGPKSGSNGAFSFGQDLVFGADFAVPARYTLSLLTGDIDSNKTLATSTFVLEGELCNNGRQDAGENGVDIGGACLGDGECNADWQCLAGQCGADGRCINRPVIRNVDVGGSDPDSWDGAPGSWATIIGNFFGEQAGNVDFGLDNNNDGNIDQWVAAPLAACNGMDVWSDRQVIVEIPNIPVGTSTTIRVKTPALGDKPSYEDLSTDNNGPKSGPNAGIFRISNNDHPGLCAVLGPNNTNIASSTAQVSAFGRALGIGRESALLFGNINAPIRQWGEQIILSSVPQNMRPGKVGVRAKVGDNFTNGVEFIVVNGEVNLVPQVDAVSPYPTSTLGSLVTLSGARFGAHGVVYMADNKEDAIACAEAVVPGKEANCGILDLLSLPDACGNTWGENQIIGKIPQGMALGQYFFVVKNDAGLHSDGAREITLVAGAPLPGLCRLEPKSGVAPLAENAKPLVLTGINLNPNPELYFWSVGSSWLISSRDRAPGADRKNVIRSVAANGTTIETLLPVGNNGVSMVTGPILARVAGNFSNSVQYTVNDCTLGGAAPGDNYQCCNSGPERGVWKPEGFACAGETRSAGYIWRFTTGLIPQVPRVLEACNVEQWGDLAVENFVRPSPSPWKNWNVGDACTDSVITVQFNMRMSEANVANQVRVYTCGQDETPDCSYDEDTDVTRNYAPVFVPGQSDILELRLAAGAVHATGTWHRVILGNNLRANEPGLVQFNQNLVNTSQLSLQRTLPEVVNGITVAYNFDFKTGLNRCSLFGAAITPPTYTAHLLGMVQNTGFPLSTNFDNPPHPFYFYVWGRGKQSCSVVDVNGQGWQWKPRQNNNADAGSNFAYATKSDNTANVPVTSTQYYKDVRATVTALQNTLLSPVYLTASTNTIVDGVNKQVTGTSTLYVQLGDPVVTEWWPECSESCTNATIGVRFNLPMITSTYRTVNGSAIRVEKCLGLGENCVDTLPLDKIDDVNPGAFDPFEYAVTVRNNLEIGTLYQVTVTDQILSFGGVLNGQPIVGKPLIPKVWKFRTKMQDGICILDTVDVLPASYVASLVGEKTPYAATPMSSPDQCSASGQRLNPWAYGWNWSVQNDKVASTTRFATKGIPPGFCSLSCLPAGSDVPLGQTAFLCGNGTVDPGEDCDVALAGEIPGVSCSLSCLRPGNNNVTSTRNPAALGLCGNGAQERNFGEECDPGIPGQNPYCTNTCTWIGSDTEFSGEVNALQCGNGFIGLGEDGLINLGEDCDIGISLQKATQNGNPAWSALGCSNRCLHEGTRMSRVYCEDPANNLTEEQENSAGCYNSMSICGNNDLEPGEECELNPADDRQVKVFGRDGREVVLPVDSARSVCSNRCILKNVCALRANISPDFICVAGTPGCSDQCTKLGSSPLYTPASLCGDGDVGIGENSVCEPLELADVNAIGQDPLQIVTAVGTAAPNPDTLRQETTVSAQATHVKISVNTTTPLRDRVTGSGDYALQCGFVEYPEPRIENGIVSANNCPDQSQGVDKNSCCKPRPVRVEEYPLHGAGIGDDTLVCQNTLISADFDNVLDSVNIENSVLLASLHPAGYDCATSSEVNVTGEVNTLLAFSDSSPANQQGVFARVWGAMKEFFANIFESVVHAAPLGGVNLNNAIQREVAGKVWCTGKITLQNSVQPKFHEDGTPNGSSVRSVISDILSPSTMYAVVLRGGNAGIKDLDGVSIRGNQIENARNQFHKDDVFIFKTSSQICKIESIAVTPDSHLFVTPSSTHRFQTEVKSNGGAAIVSTPSYAWNWRWEPTPNALFTLAPVGNGDVSNISSTGLEGNLTVAAQATITADLSSVSNEVGKVYLGLVDLTSLFCENPWPSQATYPYEDGVTAQSGVQNQRLNNDNFDVGSGRFDGKPLFPISIGGKAEYLNFSFGYCADAGAQANKADDLPLLRPVVQGNIVIPSTCNLTGSACQGNEDCRPVRQGAVLKQQVCQRGRIENDDNITPGTLKKFLFFNEKNQDLIGVQVFENAGRLSARDWFISKGFSGIERYQNIIVDGYDAISDGRNIYISSLNELSDKRVHSYIYLFGINENSQANTKQVLDKIMSTLKFNINIPERNSCVAGNGVSGGQYLPLNLNNIAVTGLFCSSDFDCRNSSGVPTSTSNGLCANAKTKFQNDWKRLTLVRDIQGKLETYRANNGQYPALLAGTYIPGYTNTHWPSWNRLLEAIGPVAQPPINKWSACGHCANPEGGRFAACSTDADCSVNAGTCVLPDDPQTCWNSAEATFSCPAVSSVLEYKIDPVTNRYELFLPLEYFNSREVAQKSIVTQFVSSTLYESTSSCGEDGLQVVRAAAGSCGNGILEANEQCDPPGSSRIAAAVACPQGQTAFRSCNASCQYDAPICRPSASCGNGRVEGGELCDDGNLNNTYGHCNSDCSAPFAAFCGNGTRDFDDKNKNGRQDADEGFVEFCDKNEGRFTAFGFCEFNPSKECVPPADILGAAGAVCGLGEGNCISKGDPTYHLTALDNRGQVSSCSNDCQSQGGYCGDGRLQLPVEACDDGNRENLDGCNAFCQVENNACTNALAPQSILSGNNNTFITVDYGSENLSDSCVNTDGDALCRGLGLSCRNVSSEQLAGFEQGDCPPGDIACRAAQGAERFEFVSFGAGSCQRNLNKDLNKRVQIECNGLRANVPVEAAAIGACGNGQINEGEVCDTGANNGIKCSTEYGRTCSYCSADCREVLTVDPIASCGNGRIDVDGRLPLLNGAYQPEVCDIDPQTNQVVIRNVQNLPNGGARQDIYQNIYNSQTVIAQCSDKGAFRCENNCQRLVSNCVDCVDSNANGKAIPKLSVLNVLTPLSNQFNGVWGSNVDRILVRLNTSTIPSGLNFMGGTGGWINGNAGIVEDTDLPAGDPEKYRNYQKAYDTRNYNNLSWLLSGKHGFPLDLTYGYRVSSNRNGPWANAPLRQFEQGIESSALCKDDYGVYFNLLDATVALGGQRNAVNAVLRGQGAKGQYERYGSFFPYPVNGEFREVQNEYVLSPAVPEGTFRVVVKWKKLPDVDVQFAPVIYNRDFLNRANANNDERLQSVISYARAIAEKNRPHPGVNLGANPSWLCSRMAQQVATKYWLPNDCIPFNYQGAARMGQADLNLAKSGGVYVHERGSLANVSASAMTIFTGNYLGNPSTGTYNAPYAIFVEAITAQGGLPISSFDNLDVTLEIYDYRDGQNADFSLYQPRPTNVFLLRSSRGSSNDEIAKYWHAVNLVKDANNRYQLTPVREQQVNGEAYPQGITVTNFADVLCRVPGENCNRDQ